MKNYNDVFTGILIGFFVALGLFWFLGVGNKSPTFWCSYLSRSEAAYCSNLYEKAIRNIDNMPEQDYPPMPL
ncbi:MAG: hypothetical protein WCJ74_02155 [bacterium]